MKKIGKRMLLTFVMATVFILGNSSCNKMSAAEEKTSMEESDYKNYYISEDNYENEMSKVEQYLNSKRKSGYFKGKENINIYYEKYNNPNAKSTIVISHGFRESLEKYNEVIYYFLKNGYSVYGLEYRGHARSARLGKDSSQTSIDNFDYYVEDLKEYVDTIVKPENKDEKLFLYAHSMGGAIGGLFLERYPKYFKAAVLSAPMFEVNTGRYPEFFSKAVANIFSLVGFGDNYAPGHHEYSGESDFETSCTTSKSRYDYYLDKTNRIDDLKNGGASFEWVKGALKATSEVTDSENASKVNIPILLFQAENDDTVRPDGENKFANEAKKCKLIVVKDSKHEIYREKDDIMIPYFNKVFNFFNNNQ
ncbi:alpha/beta hydrolase [Clostridium felsineum]|uniref:alpha/beta fold hydrolase n=1 Tax=Clostridium felsineum TaxID=36839 RepID=UPI00098CC43A|nr:alpha/beta hydrolase [Clostridium felsineum]MCR3757736.1 alpha/beta hydrolase [Clostridium felsineum]URZ01018.1 Lysophospholipase L2 [Clostridium felsineum]